MAKNGTPDLFWGGGVVVVDWIPIIISPDMAKTACERATRQQQMFHRSRVCDYLSDTSPMYSRTM